MYILTADLFGEDSLETEFWVEIEELTFSNLSRVSPEGENTLELQQDEIKDKTIAQIESMLKKEGFILCKVGFDRIYFKKA